MFFGQPKCVLISGKFKYHQTALHHLEIRSGSGISHRSKGSGDQLNCLPHFRENFPAQWASFFLPSCSPVTVFFFGPISVLIKCKLMLKAKPSLPRTREFATRTKG